MMSIIRMMWEKIPKPDSFSLTWPPSLNFPLKKDAEPRNIQSFEVLIDRANWRKELIGNGEFWICEDDNTYQIDLSVEGREFVEEWVNNYPDKNAHFQPVLLKIGGVVVKEVHYVYCDGGRIFVPLPNVVSVNEGNLYRFEWNRNSIEFKLAKIIGRYYIWKTIERVANQSKIRII